METTKKLPDDYRGYKVTAGARAAPDAQWIGLYSALEIGPGTSYQDVISGTTKGAFPSESAAKAGAMIACMTAVDRLSAIRPACSKTTSDKMLPKAGTDARDFLTLFSLYELARGREFLAFDALKFNSVHKGQPSTEDYATWEKAIAESRAAEDRIAAFFQSATLPA